MAITRVKTSGILAATMKSDSFLAGNPTYDPSTMDPIAYVTAAGGETTLTFSSIPQTYASLQIRGIAKNQSTSSTTGIALLSMQLNNDTATNYATHGLNGDGSTATGFAIANTGRMHVGSVSERTDSTFKVTGPANVTTSLTVGTTLAAGNTTITGFANVSGNTYVGNSTVFWLS